jgi:hypothetical protein
MLVSDVNFSDHGQSRSEVARRRRPARFEKLIRDPCQRADDDHTLKRTSALDYGDQPSNRGRVFHRRASELHHYHFVALLKSAVGSVDLLKIALHHPIPSSRRHVVIRVDVPVSVDVIRFDFWTDRFMNLKNNSKSAPSD